MPRPVPTRILHFTHIDHLRTIIENGLVADTQIQGSGFLAHEAGDPGIKDHRQRRPVDTQPGGVVGDYVPFYFAPRSPMMYRIHMGGVPEYQGHEHDLVYLVTTIEQVQAAGGTIVLTDRNAAKTIASFTSEPSDWDDLVDWALMRQAQWYDIPEYPDRKERRMAECLVHRSVPWSVITDVVTHDTARQQAAQAILRSAGAVARVHVGASWYF